MPALPSNPTVALVGATGAVGVELLSIIAQRGFPAASIRPLASARSAGMKLPFAGDELTVEELTAGSFDGIDLALMCASGTVSRDYAQTALDAGAIVIDNSSAFRMAPAVPLVVPEVNAEAIGDARLIANPNCSTIIMVTAVNAIERAFGIDRVCVATYQAVSGAGAPGLEELERLTAQAAAGAELAPEYFPFPCVHNVFCHESPTDPATGRNVEEQKLIDESRKIWHRPDLRASATCVRVPVPRAHTEAVNLTLRRPVTELEFRAALESAPGVRIVDDRTTPRFPMPVDASGGDDVLVGRIRPDDSQPIDGPAFIGWDLFCSGDQLRKGAALNALQIAELLLPS